MIKTLYQRRMSPNQFILCGFNHRIEAVFSFCLHRRPQFVDENIKKLAVVPRSSKNGAWRRRHGVFSTESKRVGSSPSNFNFRLFPLDVIAVCFLCVSAEHNAVNASESNSNGHTFSPGPLDLRLDKRA